MPIAFTTLLSAKGLAAASAALLAVGGGSAVLASQGKASEHPPSVQTPLVSPSASPSAVSLNPLGQPSLSFLPGTHGLAVTSAVASCAAALSTGEHGIGSCFSKVASANGQLHRSGRPSPSPHSSPPAHPTPR